MARKRLQVGSCIAGRHSPFLIPQHFVTETAGILARRGAGKTYCGHVLAEELLDAGQQIVVVDPLNAWWGLRSSASGKSKGYEVVVFGGPRGDLPLEESMGPALADLVAETGISCVLSLRHLTKSKARRFVDAFATRLFHRKGDERYATPMHLFIDEADLCCPQRVMGEVAHLVGAIEDLVRRGRQAGIGITMITQRAASLNKDVLTQVEMLVTGQITGPQDKKAILEWIKDNADADKQKEFMSSLATLQTGQFWFWSPAALKCFDLVQVRTKRTFDSSATPKPGKRIALPKKAAQVDLARIRKQIEGAVKTAEENDPKILQRRVRELQKELKTKVAPRPAPQAAPAGVTPRQVEALVTDALVKRDREWTGKVGTMLEETRARLRVPTLAKPAPIAVRETRPGTTRQPAVAARVERPASPLQPRLDGTLGKCERALLTVLAQLDRPVSNRLLALQSEYSVKSSGFSNAKSALRTAGLIEGAGKGPYTVTAEGVVALGDYDSLPTSGSDLLSHWLGKLGSCPRKILAAVAGAYPESLTREQIAEEAGYSATSSGFSNSLSTLRGLELIEPGYPVRLAEELAG